MIYILDTKGLPIDLSRWHHGDRQLALKVATWLSERRFEVAISETDDGVLLLDYGHGPSKPRQPTIKIEAGRLKFPVGTDAELLMTFLTHSA